MLPGMDFAAIGDLADVEPVPEKMGEGTDAVAGCLKDFFTGQLTGFGRRPSAVREAARAPTDPSRR